MRFEVKLLKFGVFDECILAKSEIVESNTDSCSPGKVQECKAVGEVRSHLEGVAFNCGASVLMFTIHGAAALQRKRNPESRCLPSGGQAE